jgi:hypothetical protein
MWVQEWTTRYVHVTLFSNYITKPVIRHGAQLGSMCSKKDSGRENRKEDIHLQGSYYEHKRRKLNNALQRHLD